MSLRVAALFATLGASVIGIGIPLYYKKHSDRDTPMFKCMKACAAGVMLGIGLCHLLAEANEELSEVVPDYPVAYAVTAGGVLLVVVIEQLSIIYANSQSHTLHVDEKTKNGGKIVASRTNSDVQHKEECGFVSCDCEEEGSSAKSSPVPVSAALVPSNAHDHSHDHDHAHHSDCCAKTGDVELGAVGSSTGDVACDVSEHKSCIHNHHHGQEEMFTNLMHSSSTRDVVSVYVMELSVAIHSIIIGVEIGLLAGTEDTVTLVSLTIAICFHQFMEGFGLGTTLCNVLGGYNAASGLLGNFKLFLFVLIFAVTVPLGIVIGIVTASSESAESDSSVLAKGIASSLAAGSLLYISLAEMMAVYFNAPELSHQPGLKIAMLLSACAGTAILAILAIWA